MPFAIKIISILSIIFMVNVYAEDTNSIFNAEYCFTYYTTSNCGFLPSDWKLRISNLFKNVDFPKLDEEKAQCERILLDNNLSMCFDCGIKFSLRHNFSYINPCKQKPLDHTFVDTCYSSSRFYSVSDLKKEIASLEQKFKECKDIMKDTIAIVKKEIDSIEQGLIECKLNSDVKTCFDLLDYSAQKINMCNVFKINIDKHYSSLDTNIWIKFMIDNGCNEVKDFSIRYKKNGIIYDSIFHFNDGYWKLGETDELTGSYKSKDSDGIKREILYDKQKRLIYNLYIIHSDTIKSEQHFWENDKLTKTIFNGEARNFIYGTPCDFVRVDPSDWHQIGGFNPPPIYDKSFGLIPEEGDPEYDDFKMRPYEFRASPKVLERQKARCEEYKKEQLKKEDWK